MISDKYPNCIKAFDYADKIISGEIVACKLVILSCERFKRDLKDKRFYFDYDSAERVCDRIQRFPHIKGDLANTPLKLEPWQLFIYCNVFGFKWVDTKLRRFKKVYLCVARKNGKALSLDTPIATPSGYISMGDLIEGDYVISEEGSPVLITFKSEIQKRESYEVTFCNGEKIIACEDHNWFTWTKDDRANRGRGRKYNPSVKTTKEIYGTLKCRGEINHTIPVPNKIEFNKRNLETPPYIMGYWLGNGCKNNGRISTQDKDVVDFFKEKYEVTYESKYDYYVRGIVDDLKKYSLGRGEEKYIPEDFLLSSVEDRLEFLKGLMDSDGGVSSKKGDIEFSQSNKKIINQVASLLTTLGIKHQKIIERESSYRNSEGIKIPCKISYRLIFRPLFNVFKCDRKKNKWDDVTSTLTRKDAYHYKILNVVPVGIKEVACITVDSPTSLYLSSKSNIPTHNTALSSPLGLYMMSLDGEEGAEIYSLASKKDQARIVFDSAREQARRTQSFLNKAGVTVYKHHLEQSDSASTYKPLSSDTDSADGLNPHLVVLDEVHSFKDRNMFGVMETAIGARSQPLLWSITTAGSDTSGICYELQMDLEKVLRREYNDETQFGMIYTLDPEDDFRNPEIWIKANPNLGISVKIDYLQGMVDKAVRQPANKNNVLTKHFNMWCNAEEAFFSVDKWNALADPTLSIERFLKKPCFMGIDLASKIDLTAKVKIFLEDGIYYIFEDCYLPEAAIEDSMNASYKGWVEEGHLIKTPGEAINLEFIEKEIIEDSKKVKISELEYDPWNATQLAQNLTKSRINVSEFRMSTANLSEPMKSFEALIREGKVRHRGNPVTAWCLSNVVAKADSNDNVFPKKTHAKFKIDIAVAIIMAIAPWLQKEQKESVYQVRGIRSF